VTPDATADGTAGFTFDDGTKGNPTAIHDCVNVSDNNTGTTVTGQICSTTPFTYSRTVTVPNGCVTVNNTASFAVTDPEDTGTDTDDSGSASATAKICRTPANTGALTMGFWQNKNGQGIISGGAYTGTAKVCNSGTWLFQFNPFQDLSHTATVPYVSTATCSQVASYVYNTIKAAQCSSTTKTCNTMLKAQMLATALDVYFSDSSAGFGGNKIGAFDGLGSAQLPVGGFQIDLTQTCSMLDGSGGTATCSGTYQDATSVFGGAVCPTVSAMLAYSNADGTATYNNGNPVSNVGGTNWYLQNKPKQVLAKNSFDAINNRAAFSCT
jgi:hypothetical protein